MSDNSTSGLAEPKLYNPTDEQLQQQRKDRKAIDRALRYRSKFEGQWTTNIDKWNLIAPPGLDGTPNYVVPISRMATNTGIVSMRQDLPDIVPVPEGADEKKLTYILREASAHVHRMSNMEGVLDQAIVDYAVIGNMVLQSFVDVPYKAKRIPILDESGEPTNRYKTIYKRDWSRPKIGTRSRSPWDCAFDPGAEIPAKVRYCWFQDRMTEGEFDEMYRNNPEGDFQNLDCIKAGQAWTIDDKGQLERIEPAHDKIVIDNYQSELEDCWRKYANGVLIWDVPLSSVHEHGKITLSLIPNHHKYDDNKKTHALYGTGDPELLSDVDDLINAATNMFILNYRNKNTYVPSIEGAIDVDDIDITSGQPIAGKVTIQSLGAADLPEFEAFKNNLEEWGIQMVKKNWKRLEGEAAKTAYEAAQKKDSENMGMQYQIKKMESGGLLEYAKKHVSDIMEHLTVEEWADVTDEEVETIRELMKSGELEDEDVVQRSSGGSLVPVKVRYIEKIKTRGRVYEQKGKKRSLDKLQEVKDLRGQDGWLPASSEYLHTRGWKLFKRIPDVYLIGKTILGQDNVAELSKLEQLMNFLTQVANLQMMEAQSGTKSGIDWSKFIEKGMTSIDIRKEDVTQNEGDKKITDIKEKIASVKAQRDRLLNPQANAQIPTPVQGGTPQPQPVGAGQAPQAGNPLAVQGAA